MSFFGKDSGIVTVSSFICSCILPSLKLNFLNLQVLIHFILYF
ncbi:hypothetical protein BBU94A_AD15 (plasmid) [Borreliella burgdorferi 94a]|nr:hypothetical protein BBU94A_AD15 [Borreliella burgdorferi 94a]